MSSELRDLYQEVILDHNRKPRNFRKLTSPTRGAEGYNPLCGDRVTVEIALEGDMIKSVSLEKTIYNDLPYKFEAGTPHIAGAIGLGVALEYLEGLELDHVAAYEHELLAHGTEREGVREFPSRIKCATLPWHTLHAALAGQTEPVSTESSDD